MRVSDCVRACICVCVCKSDTSGNFDIKKLQESCAGGTIVAIVSVCVRARLFV